MRVMKWLVLTVIAFVWELFFPRAPLPEIPRTLPAKPEKGEGHEVSDVHPGQIFAGVAALFATVIAVMVVIGGMQRAVHFTRGDPAITMESQSFRNAPFAQTSIADAWDNIDKTTRAHLEGYRWIDRGGGVLAIPVERAMQLVAREGLPARTRSRRLSRRRGMP